LDRATHGQRRIRKSHNFCTVGRNRRFTADFDLQKFVAKVRYFATTFVTAEGYERRRRVGFDPGPATAGPQKGELLEDLSREGLQRQSQGS